MLIVLQVWKMFSLKNLAYCVCDGEEKYINDDLEMLTIKIQPCCIDTLNYLKMRPNQIPWMTILLTMTVSISRYALNESKSNNVTV